MMSMVQMSLSGAVIILIIVGIRALFLNRLPKKTFLALWGVALLRLLVPVSIPSVWSVYSLAQQTAKTGGMKEIPTGVAAFAGGAPNVVSAPVSISAASPDPVVSPWLFPWMAGALLCVFYFMAAYIKCRREFAVSLPVKNKFTQEWLAAHRLQRQISIRQYSRAAAPLTCGIFRPVILMPKQTDWTDTERLQYVLEHEYVHIRRFDAAAKLLITAALCVHWFNPLVWVMYVLFNKDIELSCDETVVRRFGEKNKSAYALTLISMEEAKGGMPALCSHFSKNAIEERITAIMKMKKISLAAVISGVLLITGVTTVFATSPVGREQAAGSSDAGGSPQTVRQVSADRILPGERIEYGAFDFQAGDRIACDISWANPEGNLFFAYGRNGKEFSGLVTSGENERALKKEFLVKEDGKYYVFLGNQSSGRAPIEQVRGTVSLPASARNTSFSQEELNRLLALRFDGYEDLTVEEYRNRVWEATDTEEYRSLFDKFSQNTELREMRYTNSDAAFLFDVLFPLTAKNRQSASFNGSVRSRDGSAAAEYAVTCTIQDTGRLTVGEYERRKTGMAAGLQALLDGKTAEELRDGSAMSRSISAETDRLKAQWESEDLRFDVTFGFFPPESTSGETTGGEKAEEQKTAPATKEDYQSVLALKTADYQNRSVAAFDKALLDWANEDYDRMERVNGIAGAGRDEFLTGLTDEELRFVNVTLAASGQENAVQVRSLYTGSPEEAVQLGWYDLLKTGGAGRSAAGYYMISYRIENKEKLSVKERDDVLLSVEADIQSYWDALSLEQALALTENDFGRELQKIAETRSLKNMPVQITKFQYEAMNEPVPHE